MQFELLPPVPAVVLARELRRIPLFSFASADELFRFSEISQQVRHAEGSVFQKKGAPAEYIQVLIEGRARISGAGKETEESGPPRLFGFREVLEGSPFPKRQRPLKPLSASPWGPRISEHSCRMISSLRKGSFRCFWTHLPNPPGRAS